MFRVPRKIPVFAENDALDLTHIHKLRKILKFNLIYWCRDFAEMDSFRRVSGKLSETLRKLCISAKFPHQEITLNFGILYSGSFEFGNVILKLPLQNRSKHRVVLQSLHTEVTGHGLNQKQIQHRYFVSTSSKNN